MADQNIDNNTTTSNGNGNGTSSWAMWQRLVLSEIKRLDEGLKDVEDEVQKLEIKIAVLQTKSALYGALAGALFAGAVELVVYLTLGHLTGTGGKH